MNHTIPNALVRPPGQTCEALPRRLDFSRYYWVPLLILALAQGCGRDGGGQSKSESASPGPASEQPSKESPKHQIPTTGKNKPASPQQTLLLNHAKQFFSCTGLPEDVLQITTPKSSFKMELKGVGAADFQQRLKDVKSAASLKTLSAFVALFDSKLASRVESDQNLKFRDLCNTIFPLTIENAPLYLVLEPTGSRTIAPTLIYYEFKIPNEMTMVYDPADADNYYYEVSAELKTVSPERQPDGRLKYPWSPLIHNGLLLAGDGTFIRIHSSVLEERYRGKRDEIESKLKLNELDNGRAVEEIKAFAKDAVAKIQKEWSAHPQAYDRLVTLASCISQQHGYKTALFENMDGLEAAPKLSSPLAIQVVEDMSRNYIQLGKKERKPDGYYTIEVTRPEKVEGTAYLASYPERWLAAYVPSGAIFCPGDLRVYKVLTPVDLVENICSKMDVVEFDRAGVHVKQVQLGRGISHAPVSYCAFHKISSWSEGLAETEAMLNRAREEDQYYLQFLSEHKDSYKMHDIAEVIEDNDKVPSCRVRYSLDSSVYGEYGMQPAGSSTMSDLLKRIFTIFEGQKDCMAADVVKAYYPKPSE